MSLSQPTGRVEPHAACVRGCLSSDFQLWSQSNHLVSTHPSPRKGNHHINSLNSVGFTGNVRPTWYCLHVEKLKVDMSLWGPEFFP